MGTGGTGPAGGLGVGARGSDLGSAGPHSGDKADLGAGMGADVGRDSSEPNAPSASPGSDPSATGLGGDSELLAELADDRLPEQGLATRAARDGDPRGADGPARVPGERDAETTPGYTP